MTMNFHILDVSLNTLAATLIIGVNMLALMVLLNNRRMRTKPLYLMLISLVCSDLLMGAFVIPMHLRSMLVKKWHSCEVQLAFQVTGYWVTFFVTGWTLVIQTLTVSRRTAWLHRNTPSLVTLPTRVRVLVSVFWPWKAAIILAAVVCIKYKYEHNPFRGHSKEGEDITCVLMLRRNAIFYLWVVCYLLPVAVLVYATVALYCDNRRNRSSKGMILLTASNSTPCGANDNENATSQETVHNGVNSINAHHSPKDEIGENPDTVDANTDSACLNANSKINCNLHQSNLSTHNDNISTGTETQELIREEILGHSEARDLIEDMAVEDWRKRIVIPNLVYIICVTPLMLFIFMLNVIPHYLDYFFSYKAEQILLITWDILWKARSFLLPLSWLSFRHIRLEVLDDVKSVMRFFASIGRQKPPSTDSTVRFRNLNGNPEV